MEGAQYARYRVFVAMCFFAFQGDTGVDFHIPQPNTAVLVTCRYEAAVSKKSHAGDLGVLRALHDCGHMHVLRVPQADAVVERSSDDLRVVWHPLPSQSLKALGLESYNLQDRPSVSLHIRLLRAASDFEDSDTKVCLHQKAPCVVKNLHLLNLFPFR